MGIFSKKNLNKVLEMLKILYKCKRFLNINDFLSDQLNELTNEIDKCVQRYMAQYPGVIDEINLQKVDAGISPKKQDDVIELLYLNRNNREDFCHIFPIWKQYRLELILCLREMAGKLEKEDKSLQNLYDAASSASGMIAGLMKLANMVISAPLPTGFVTVANLFSATHGIIRCFTSANREMNLECLMKETGKIMERDKRQFQQMTRWFEYNVKLMNSVKSAIGSELYKLIFVTIKEIYDKIRLENPSGTKNCEIFFDKIVEFLIKEGATVSWAIPMAAASLKLYVLLSSALLCLNWPDAALHISRIANYGKAAVYGSHASIAAYNIYNPHTVLNNDIFSAIGIILDMAPAILDLSRSEKNNERNEQAENICKIANIMEEEITRIEYVYTTVNNVTE